jgi:glucan phosphoethanolaminetransferase (alkaline phosphatase superfamily)
MLVGVKEKTMRKAISIIFLVFGVVLTVFTAFFFQSNYHSNSGNLSGDAHPGIGNGLLFLAVFAVLLPGILASFLVSALAASKSLLARENSRWRMAFCAICIFTPPLFLSYLFWGYSNDVFCDIFSKEHIANETTLFTFQVLLLFSVWILVLALLGWLWIKTKRHSKRPR